MTRHTDKESEMFSYTYSAAQRDEIENIRKKYIRSDNQAGKMEELRKLDKGSVKYAKIPSLTVGVCGILTMGGGMSAVMVWNNFVLGIPLGLAGVCLMAVAPLLYRYLLKKRRERIAPRILELTEELLKGKQS